MSKKLVSFLRSIFGVDKVLLAYSDRVTKPGLSVIYYQGDESYTKELDGTTHMRTGNYVVQIWHDSLAEVIQAYDVLFDAMEGTEYQILSSRPVRVDGNKRKWHKEITLVIMEDL